MNLFLLCNTARYFPQNGIGTILVSEMWMRRISRSALLRAKNHYLIVFFFTNTKIESMIIGGKESKRQKFNYTALFPLQLCPISMLALGYFLVSSDPPTNIFLTKLIIKISYRE